MLYVLLPKDKPGARHGHPCAKAGFFEKIDVRTCCWTVNNAEA